MLVNHKREPYTQERSFLHAWKRALESIGILPDPSQNDQLEDLARRLSACLQAQEACEELALALGTDLARLSTRFQLLEITQQVMKEHCLELQDEACLNRLAGVFAALTAGFVRQVESAPPPAKGWIYRGLFDTTPEAVTMTDLQGRIIMTNATGAALHGYAGPADMLGLSAFDLIAPEERPRALENLQMTMESGIVRGVEYNMLRADGSTFPAELSASKIVDAEGNPTAFLAVVRDITDRKRGHRTFQTLIENSLQGIVVFQQGHVVFANPAALETCGYSLDELVELSFKGLVSLVDPQDFDLTLARLENIRAGRALSQRFDLRIRHRDGSTRWIDAIAARIDFRGGAAFLVATVDITERKQAEQQLRQAHDELERRIAARTADLERANRELQAQHEHLRQLARQVVSIQEEERLRISRELHDEAGQALVSLKLSLDALRFDLPDGAEQLQQRLGGAIDLIDTAMQNIRALAHGLRPPELEVIGPNRILRQHCQDFAARTGLSIEYHGEELPSLSDAAGIGLYRFLQETLTNVARHAQASRVEVNLNRANGFVRLSVRDNGRGFDPQAGSEGIGLLGLRERFGLLEGELELWSRPGQGTRVSVFLPVGKNTS